MNESKKRILITGASGLIGTRLTELLLANAYDVWHLSRSRNPGIKTFLWDIEKQTIEAGAFEGVDAIIHLAGAGVADKRWTKQRKKEILDSRTKSTELLFRQLKAGGHNVTTVLSASAIGYYGFKDPQRIFTEDDPAGNDFLASVTAAWEMAVDKITTLNIRVVKIRIGIVLSKNGGALQPIATSVKLYAGSPLGTGDQYMSWIHIDDVCQIFIKALGDEHIRGAINAAAPNPVTNRDFIKAVAMKLGKPVILPAVPAFVLRLMFGEMGDIVLEGSKVSPEKIEKAGFSFRFKTLGRALEDLLK